MGADGGTKGSNNSYGGSNNLDNQRRLRWTLRASGSKATRTKHQPGNLFHGSEAKRGFKLLVLTGPPILFIVLPFGRNRWWHVGRNLDNFILTSLGIPRRVDSGLRLTPFSSSRFRNGKGGGGTSSPTDPTYFTNDRHSKLSIIPAENR